MIVRLLGIALTGMLLVGCATQKPISANLAADVAQPAAPKTDLGRVVLQGLQDASWNLDQAVVVGALALDDPAPKCLHEVLGQLGADPVNPVLAGASFMPKVSDLISGGSVLYIRAQQAKRLQRGGVTVPVDCKLLVMQFMLDAAAAGTDILPGGGALIKLR